MPSFTATRRRLLGFRPLGPREDSMLVADSTSRAVGAVITSSHHVQGIATPSQELVQRIVGHQTSEVKGLDRGGRV